MANALIVYASRTGETEAIANLIAEGIRIAGHSALVKNVNQIESEQEISECDALVLGSATYHGDMLQGMKKFLFMAEKADLAGKPGGSFGAFGWSGEAPGRIFDTMQHIFKMDMTSGPLTLKSSSLEGGIQMAQQYGRDLAAKMPG